MKQFFTHTLASLLLMGLVATQANAQQFSKRKQYSSIGLSVNAMNYFGDIVPKTSLPSFRAAATRPNIGVYYMHRFAPRISAKVALNYGRISGDDSKAADPNGRDSRYRYNRNMNFRNDIVELSGMAVFDLIENRNNYLKRPDFVPYITAGIAVFHHNPKAADANGDYVELQPLQTEGVDYSLTQFAIPFGGGVRYRINKSFDIGLELITRKTFTDYLDDVSGTFVADNQLVSPAAKYFGRGITRSQSAAEGFGSFTEPGQRRGKDGNDWYTTLGVTVNYILAPRVKNPKFR